MCLRLSSLSLRVHPSPFLVIITCRGCSSQEWGEPFAFHHTPDRDKTNPEPQRRDLEPEPFKSEETAFRTGDQPPPASLSPHTAVPEPCLRGAGEGSWVGTVDTEGNARWEQSPPGKHPQALQPRPPLPHFDPAESLPPLVQDRQGWWANRDLEAVRSPFIEKAP